MRQNCTNFNIDFCQNLSQDASLLNVIYIDNAHSVWFNNNNINTFNRLWAWITSEPHSNLLVCCFILGYKKSYAYSQSLSCTMANVTIFTISRLTEHNFTKWLVDIQAHLHWSKLWKYTQKNVNVTAEEELKKMNKWEKAANLMTSTLSAEIKRKLTEKNFNNRYKMLTKQL